MNADQALERLLDLGADLLRLQLDVIAAAPDIFNQPLVDLTQAIPVISAVSVVPVTQGLKDVAENLLHSTRLTVPATLMALRCVAIVRPHIRQSYEYKRLILEIIRRSLRRDSCAVDVGCHRGLFLTRIVQCAPDGDHLALEPIPALAGRLRTRFPEVDVRPVAAGESSGKTNFYLDHKQLGYSSLILWDAHRADKGRIEEIDVPLVTLDEVVPERRHIRLIKIDAVGAHERVLRGASKVIMRCRPLVILYVRVPGTGDPPERTATNTWRLLVDDYDLRISRLADWMAGRDPLSRDEFLSSVGHHDSAEFCFLAHPASSPAVAA